MTLYMAIEIRQVFPIIPDRDEEIFYLFGLASIS